MENQIQNWISEDEKLYEMIVGIQATGKSPVEQADLAFYELVKLYDIPAVPEDIAPIDKDEEQSEKKRALFIEHTLLKFLAPKEEDPRGLILSAAFNLVHGNQIALVEIANKKYGGDLSEECHIGVSGTGTYGQVVFSNKEHTDCYYLGSITKINL